MDHAVDAAIDADKQSEFSDVAYLALDDGTRRMIGSERDPGILLDLLQAKRDAALLGIDLEHLHFHLLARGNDLAGVDVLLGPAHLRDMDQAFHAGLELDEGAIVGDVGDRALEARVDRILGGDALPRIGFKLLDAEADALGLRIDADDLHLHRIADIHDLARMGDTPPCHVSDMQQTVNAAEIDEGAVVGDVLHHAVDDLAFLEAGDDLAPLLGASLLEHGAARHDDVAAAAIHFQNLEKLRHVHQRANVTDRANIDLASGQEGNGAIEVDREAALAALEDHAFDALAGFVFLFEPGPALLAAGLLARQHGINESVLDALQIDIDLIANGEIGRASRHAKFFDGDTAFGLEADIDHRDVLFDCDDGALDDAAFLQSATRQRFLEKGRELVVARMAHTCLRLGHQTPVGPLPTPKSNPAPRPVP